MKILGSGQNMMFNSKSLVAVCMLLFASFGLHAQFFAQHFNSKERRADIPTVITSDSMDLDISKNVAVFTGNVQVDDVQMKIFCHKMIINFSGEKNTDSNKSVKNIICLKNVVIIRKVNGAEAKGGEQKAVAGKAIYNVKAGKITLMDNPELHRGPDTLTGEVIMFWLDSERLSVQKKTKLKIRSKPHRTK